MKVTGTAWLLVSGTALDRLTLPGCGSPGPLGRWADGAGQAGCGIAAMLATAATIALPRARTSVSAAVAAGRCE